MREYLKRKQDKKVWTEDYLMVFDDLAPYFLLKAESPQVPITRESWVDVFAKAVRETETGVVIHQWSIVSVVGRKAKE